MDAAMSDVAFTLGLGYAVGIGFVVLVLMTLRKGGGE